MRDVPVMRSTSSRRLCGQQHQIEQYQQTAEIKELQAQMKETNAIVRRMLESQVTHQCAINNLIDTQQPYYGIARVK